MIRSLRTRFFLIVWPLVVAAVVAVGWFLGRWTRVELHREFSVEGERVDLTALALDDSVAAMLAAAGSAADLRGGMERVAGLAADAGLPGAAALLVDARGAILARSDEPASEDGDPLLEETVEIRDDGRLVLEREIRGADGRRVIRLQAEGTEVEAPPGFRLLDDARPEMPLRLYVLPRSSVWVEEEGGVEVRLEGGGRTENIEVRRFLDRANRTILMAVLIASAIAAIATLLIAQPVVGRARRLASAARGIREGDLSARVPASSGDELGDVEQAFNEMARELERSETLKRRLVTDVAHELRTPLTNLVGMLEAVEDGLKRPDQATLASLRDEVGLLEHLVEDLQELAIAEAGALKLNVEDVDLLAAARAARTAFEPVMESTGVDIEVEADGVPADHVKVDERTPPYLVRADARRVGQILRNLIRNAVTHSREGGSVAVEIRRRGANLDVAVRDEGPGISAEHLDLIWERFYRVDASRDRASGGSGLGLPIVKRLVEAQGGRVWAESRPGEGAAFHFTLPAA